MQYIIGLCSSVCKIFCTKIHNFSSFFYGTVFKIWVSQTQFRVNITYVHTWTIFFLFSTIWSTIHWWMFSSVTHLCYIYYSSFSCGCPDYSSVNGVISLVNYWISWLHIRHDGNFCLKKTSHNVLCPQHIEN